jgi:hypothetical protein
MKKTGIWLAALCACALLLSVVVVNATPQAPANVAGAWTITMAPPAGGGGGGGNGGGGGGGRRGGGGPQVFTFKQDGAKITGTIPGFNGGPDTAFEGTVSGNDVSWTVKRTMQDGTEIATTYKGTVDGDSMKGTRSSNAPNATPRDFTATRSK